MFFSCPHCRELVTTDRDTRLPPTMCPRCGGVLREASPDEVDATSTSSEHVAGASSRSFASFLRSKDPAPVQAAQSVIETGDGDDEPVAWPAADIIDAPREEMSSLEEASPDTVALEAGDEIDLAIPILEIVEPLPAAAAQSPVSVPASMPSFSRQAARTTTVPTRAARWQWVALAALSLALMVQVLVADRAKLAADPAWRPVIARMCSVLGCSLPAWHQPGAFKMLSRSVTPIAGSRALQAQATFRNDAAWAQGWPVLVLSLSDADGRTVGTRAFTPREYLGTAATQTELGAGQSAQIAFQLHEPNPDVVAFAFDFR